jgi:cell division septation protein DedD
VAEADRERYAEPRAFAREVNLPLLGEVSVAPIPSGAPLADLLRSEVPPSIGPVVDSLTQTRQSLTLRSLLLAGFSHDAELFAVGLALAREWTRRGLRVAVVDLDFWSPSIVRPPGEPNEGLIDMLEFGCSFRRVAWEIVADRLWLVGPGTYLPEAERVAGHPDWDRAARVMNAQVDVVFHIAPLLERGGFLARLSKRMDGVLIASSVDRVPRTRLRDAFLELWGSDAPMIGCLGILPAKAPTGDPPQPAPGVALASRAHTPRGSDALEEHEAATLVALAAAEPIARPGETRRLEARAPEDDNPARSEAAAAAGRVAQRSDAREDADLIAQLEAEARTDPGPASPPKPRGRRGLWMAAAAVVLVAGGAALYAAHRAGQARGGAALEEAQPTGIERVLPAQLGAPSGGGYPMTQPGSPPAPGPEPAALPATGPKAPPDAAPQGTPVARQGLPASAPPRHAVSARRQAAEAPKQAPAAGPASLPYRVHVASFRSEATVGRLAAELRAKGLTAWYEPAASLPGWYRVFVGRFATHAEAEAEAERLLHKGLVQRAKAFPDEQR